MSINCIKYNHFKIASNSSYVIVDFIEELLIIILFPISYVIFCSDAKHRRKGKGRRRIEES